MLRHVPFLALGSSLLIVFTAGFAIADDSAWPTYMHDSQRTGMVADAPELPLQLAWEYVPVHPPAPAWPLPARQNFLARKFDLPARVTYDFAFHTTSDGQRVFFGSSSDDQVRCLDLASGELLWTFFTEGPVRFAPTVADNHLLFSCDDGAVYCVNTEDGSLVWKRRLLETDRRIAGNGRIISAWPIRTDVLVDAEMARVACGLFPNQGTFQFALNAETGEIVSEGKIAFSPQGYLELQGNRLMVSQGRASSAELTQAERRGEAVSGQLGTPPAEFSLAHIGAGDLRFAGGEGKVIAYRTGNSEEVWHAEVSGSIHGLAVAGGCLLVSTDEGRIYCFSPETGSGASAGNGTSEGDAAMQPTSREAQQFAEGLLREADIQQGYCLVVGTGSVDSVIELARQSQLRIVTCVADEEIAAEFQKRLAAAGLYGRISVHVCGEGTVPYTDGLFNLVVSLGDTANHQRSPEEIQRLTRPDGGVALRVSTAGASSPGESWQAVADRPTWSRFVRPPLETAGEWTHLYGNPANTACGGDKYVSGELNLQWFGAPGPREMVDRHHRTTAPLYCSGRLFIPGNDRVYAVDAYNGFILWEREMPAFRRVGVLHNCGSMVVSDELLYAIVSEHCVALDAQTGEEHGRFAVPPFADKDERYWGFVGWVDESLYGSSTLPGASYTGHSREEFGEIRNARRLQVISDSLFCLDRHNGEKTWQYIPESGAILNTSITIGNDRIYFVESANAETLNDEKGRVQASTFFSEGSELVAVDRRTGAVIWRRETSYENTHHHLYMSYADEKLIAVAIRDEEGTVRYDVHCLDASNGESVWDHSQNSGYRINGGHGENDNHPVIVGDTLYATRKAYDLHTGEITDSWDFQRGGHGCGAFSASNSALFFRARVPTMCDLATGGHQRVSQVSRPGCWINMIPAGGLLLIPEASSGCTCDLPVQTSLGFVPAAGWEQ